MKYLYAECTLECERMPRCTTCYLKKKPVGRDSCGDWCDDDCPGYRKDPLPGHLWPGELAELRDGEPEE